MLCVFSRLLYTAETWTMKKEDIRKLLAFENQMLQKNNEDQLEGLSECRNP